MINHRVHAAKPDIGETQDEADEWELIDKMVKAGKGKKIKATGKRILSTTDKLPKSNPKVYEIEVDGTRYAIVKIITLG